MSLLQKIKDDQLKARLAKEQAKASILTTLLGEASMIGKNDGNRDTTDEEVSTVITKFIKNINDTLTSLNKNNASIIDPRIDALEIEKNILSAYLPEKLSKEALLEVIKYNFPYKTDMKTIMGFLKTKYAGLYDGKTASELINSLY